MHSRVVDLVDELIVDGLVKPLMVRFVALEELSRLEHRQWMHWSQHVAEAHDLPEELVEKWEANWVPYDQLDEETKDKDRDWALKALSVIEDVAEVEYSG